MGEVASGRESGSVGDGPHGVHRTTGAMKLGECAMCKGQGWFHAHAIELHRVRVPSGGTRSAPNPQAYEMRHKLVSIRQTCECSAGGAWMREKMRDDCERLRKGGGIDTSIIPGPPLQD